MSVFVNRIQMGIDCTPCAMPKLELTLRGLKHLLVNHQSGLGDKVAWVVDMLSPQAVAQSQTRKLDTLSQHARCNQAIPACSWPIRGQGSETHYPSMQ